MDKKDSEQDVFIARRGGLTVGYLQQNAFEDDSITLEDEIKKGFQKIMDAKARLDELLDKQKKLCEFSGGQRTRISPHSLRH